MLSTSPSHVFSPLIQDLELTYIAFDVIYMDNLHKEGPVLINKPLHERLEILRTCIATAPPVTVGEGSVTARVVPLIPNETRFGGSLASRMAHTQEEVENAIKAVSRQGIGCNCSKFWVF